ncbi:TIR domain-containing protein [Frankia sp. Cr1]|uniref:TIR domain-containing protein n=1 Tax=Frankia sp. Cr1 TaxID=3073931 RepID=UPI002AD2B540|nr:TIR domain-containing protein [Frankia sp. Cr1]
MDQPDPADGPRLRDAAPGPGTKAAGPAPGWDFFISYTAADRAWAEWIAWQLEDAGYRVLVQAWDFIPGSNWAVGMQQGVTNAAHTLALLSEAYLRSVYGRAEWQAAQAADPLGFAGRLIPIRIADCPRPGLLGQIVSFDLFDLPEGTTAARLAKQVAILRAGRAKPATAPTFPASTSSARPTPPSPEPAFPSPSQADSTEPPSRYQPRPADPQPPPAQWPLTGRHAQPPADSPRSRSSRPALWIALEQQAGASAVAFPGRRPEVSTAPPRPDGLPGRWNLLRQMRDQRSSAGRAAASALPGAGDGSGPDRRWTIRGWAAGIAAIIMVVVLAVVVWPRPFEGAHGCDGTGTAVWAMRSQAECIGYSDGAGQFFGEDKRLQTMERLVFQENQCAVALHNGNHFPPRPYVSVVYLAALTPDGPLRDLDSLPRADELEGILLQQIRQNGALAADGSCLPAASMTAPILRVIIANGGKNMRQVETVASRITALARQDPSVVAVIGMDRSTDQTARAIAQLGHAGLPVVASTLSGDGLEQQSPLYFQMVPPNAREAQLIAAYAEHEKKTRVSVYYPRSAAGSGDLYVRTLVADLRIEFIRKQIAFEDEAWDGPTFSKKPDAPTACTDTSNRMIFFAGRAADFGDFLSAMRENCPAGGQPAPILAGDAVHRYMVQPPKDDIPAGTTISFASEDAGIELTQQGCFHGTVDRANPYAPQALRDLCRDMGEFYRSQHLQPPPERWPGEWVGFGYDTAGIIVLAARTPSPGHDQPTTVSIVSELQRTPYYGATGTADFTTSHIATNKKEVIFTVELGDTTSLPACVYAIDDRPPRENCLS